MLQLAEVLLAKPVQRRAVHLRRASDEVVHSRLEGLSARVVPRVRRDVAVVHEHVLVRPVLGLARKPVATLEQEDALSGWSEVAGERPATRAGPDDDHVVGVHRSLLRWCSVSDLGMVSVTRSPHALGEDDPRSRLDQREMRERLREVAQVTAGLDVELLGEEAERRRHAQQPLHQVARAL